MCMLALFVSIFNTTRENTRKYYENTRKTLSNNSSKSMATYFGDGDSIEVVILSAKERFLKNFLHMITCFLHTSWLKMMTI